MEYESTKINRHSENKAALLPETDITASTTPELRAILKKLVAEGVRELEMDMTDVVMVDSSGIGLLVAAHNSLDRLGGKLVVTNVSRDLMELFRAFRLEKHFSIIGKPEAGA